MGPTSHVPAHDDVGVVDRREFMEKGAKAAAAAALLGVGLAGCGSDSEPDTDAAPQPGAIPTRPLGQTGLSLPILGFGGAAVVAHFGNTRSFDDRVAIVRSAYDRGVRYFDTAHSFSYGESQAVLKEALHDVRDDVFLTSKIDFWNPADPAGTVESVDPDHVTRQVDEILTELDIDHVDAILLHGTPGLEQMTVEQALEVHAALDDERRKGKLRFIGFSAHHYFDKALALISSGEFDLCMLAYGYVPRGLSRRFSDDTIALRDRCLQAAQDNDVGIVAMKVVGAGMLSGFPPATYQAACRYVLQDPRVANITIGMASTRHVEENISTVTGDLTYTPEDETRLAEAFGRISGSDRYQEMPEV